MSNASEQKIQKAMLKGGVVHILGVKVFIDHPKNYDVLEPETGFWILNSSGAKTYFKCRERTDAQKACNELYGAGRYTVNSKV